MAYSSIGYVHWIERCTRQLMSDHGLGRGTAEARANRIYDDLFDLFEEKPEDAADADMKGMTAAESGVEDDCDDETIH